VISMLLSFFLQLGPAAEVTPETALCPPDHPGTAETVRRFFTKPQYQPAMNALGLTGPVLFTPLTDSQHAQACQWFLEKFGAPGTDPNWSWVAYAVGNYYFVVFRYVSLEGEMRMGWVPLYVFNQQMQFVDGWAM
jgi:hypothetical protein